MGRSFAVATPDVGPPMTIDPRTSGTTLSALGAANRAMVGRVTSGGTITGITVEVGVASGNISVAVYRNSGSGAAARPGARVATSGAVACPAAGVQTVPLGGAVTVQPGDWFALSADNVTATFRRLLSGAGGAYLSLYGQVDAAHPTPASVTLAAAATTVMMVGT